MFSEQKASVGLGLFEICFWKFWFQLWNRKRKWM